MNGMMLSEDELLLRNVVRDFADQELSVRAADYDESAEFPWDNLDTMKKLGLFGLTIDEEYGGSGGTWRQLALVVEELARGCASTKPDLHRPPVSDHAVHTSVRQQGAEAEVHTPAGDVREDWRFRSYRAWGR